MTKSLLIALSCAILSSTALPALAATVQTPSHKISQAKSHAAIRPIATTKPADPIPATASALKPTAPVSATTTAPAAKPTAPVAPTAGLTPTATPSDPTHPTPNVATAKPATTKLN